MLVHLQCSSASRLLELRLFEHPSIHLCCSLYRHQSACLPVVVSTVVRCKDVTRIC
jgi:hypothetical protein